MKKLSKITKAILLGLVVIPVITAVVVVWTLFVLAILIFCAAWFVAHYGFM